jgi:hypothetical protein
LVQDRTIFEVVERDIERMRTMAMTEMVQRCTISRRVRADGSERGL